MPRKKKLPPNVCEYPDRHGKVRFKWRKRGHNTLHFKHHPNSPEGALELANHTSGRDRSLYHEDGTVGWAAARYVKSSQFTGGKNDATYATARAILEKFFKEFEKDQVRDFKFNHIEAILLRASKKSVNEKGRPIGGPSAANNLHGELKPFFDYCIKLGLIESNPAKLAKAISVPRGGFHTWTEGEIAQFRKHWELGTKPRLALEIFLWTAQRRGDASTFGRKHVVNGEIELTPNKTRDTSGATLWLPVAPQLKAAIDAMEVTGTETFLVNAYGKPYTVAGLGLRMREWCNAAGLPHCTAHGLRKAAARRAAESGATNSQLKALGGWTTDKQVEVYTRAVEQKKLARDALNPVIEFDTKSTQKETP